MHGRGWSRDLNKNVGSTHTFEGLIVAKGLDTIVQILYDHRMFNSDDFARAYLELGSELSI
jgi:hypothetical protein